MIGKVDDNDDKKMFINCFHVFTINIKEGTATLVIISTKMI